MSKERIAIFQMAVCAVLWSIGGVLIKFIPWNPMVIAGFRSLVAAGVFLLYLKRSGQKWLMTRRTLLIALAMCATYLCFNVANKLTTAANAIVLQYLAPVFLLGYAALVQKQKFHPMDYLVVGLTLGGVALFFLDQLSPGTLLGNLVAVLSGICFAATFLTNAGVEQGVRMNGILQGQLLTALVGIPFLFFTDNPVSVTAVSGVLALGIFQLGIPYVLFGLALRYCPPLTCSVLSAFEPLLNPVWVFLFAGEAPGPLALLGGVIVVVSVTLWCVWDAKRKAALGAAL